MRNTDGEDGPFYLSHNVIVSSDGGTPNGSRIHHYEVTAPARIVLFENLTGTRRRIVDADGNLTKNTAVSRNTRPSTRSGRRRRRIDAPEIESPARSVSGRAHVENGEAVDAVRIG